MATEPSEGIPREAVEPPRAVVRDDGRRSRLTVFFRLLLALPHFVVLALWSILAFALAVVSWFAILLTGRPVAGELQARFVRYYTHVLAYVTLAADPFPAFGGTETYPVDVEIPRPPRQNRLKTFFRLVLGLPAFLLAIAIATFLVSGQVESSGPRSEGSLQLNPGILGTAAILGWFAAIAQGRMPDGLRDLIAYGIGYVAQVWAYLLLVSDRYPTSDPLYPRYPERALEHPVRVAVTDDLRRSRLTTFFRLLLFLPHLVWLTLWGIAVFVAVFLNWFVTLVRGRPAGPFHRFTARYVRYYTHAYAFVYLVANPFPGFTGQPGSYPLDLRLPPPERQNRWKTGFRLILAIPALLLAGSLGTALGLVALFGWFTGLFLGRMPDGLRNLGVLALRYQAQGAAYVALLTDRYPFASPALESAAVESPGEPRPAPGEPPPAPAAQI